MSHRISALSCTLAAFVSLPVMAADHFEEFEGSGLAEGDRVTTEFAGLTVDDASLVKEGGSRRGYAAAAGNDAVVSTGVSGGDFLGPITLFSIIPISLTFDEVASNVSFHCYDIDAAETIVFSAYDDTGVELETLTYRRGDPGTGDAIATFIEFSTDGIRTIVVESPTSAGYGLDDLSWSTVSDADGDGLDDDDDACPDSDFTLSSTVDSTGCTVSDYCPCDGDWKNHGAYVSAVAHASGTTGAIVSAAAASDCGR